MQRRHDLLLPGFTVNAATVRRPPLYFPSSNIVQDHNMLSTHSKSPSIIDLTTQNPKYAPASYQTPTPLQNNNPQIPFPQKNSHHQTAPPPQNQNKFNTQTLLHH